MKRIEHNQNLILLRNSVIAVLLSVSTLFLLAVFVKGVKISERIKHFSIFEALTYFSIFFIVFLIDSFRTVFLSSFLGERFRFSKALENSVLGYFFSYVTPFSAGGQPFQIYHLSNSGMKTENASAIILTRWSNMLIFLSFSSTFLAFKYLRYIKTGIGFMDKVVWFIIVGSIVVSGVIVSSLLFPFVGNFVVNSLKRFLSSSLYRAVFRKDLSESVDKFSEWLKKFYSSIRKIWIEHPQIAIFDMSLGVLDLAVIFYVLYRAIENSSLIAGTRFRLSFFGLSAVFILLSYIVYYVPTPGASGGVEGGFFAVLSQYGSKSSVMRGILLWRISTYYFTILLGLVVLYFAYRRGDVFR